MKHGFYGTKEYSIWIHIKIRCYNKNTYEYRNYGLRGIKLYSDWINNPTDFIIYIKALPNFLSEGYISLDRINNDGDYEPDNLRWTTRSNQQINRRKMLSNKTGYVGVSIHRYKNKKYGDYIYFGASCGNKTIGSYKTPEEAVKARNNYIIQNNLSEYKIQEL